MAQDRAQLSLKSIVELRAMAQYLKINVNYAWDKFTLIRKIDEKIQPQITHAQPDNDPIPRSPRSPIGSVITRAQAEKALARYADRGLTFTFSSPDTIQLTHTRVKEDSCSLNVPLRVLIDCARKLVTG